MLADSGNPALTHWVQGGPLLLRNWGRPVPCASKNALDMSQQQLTVLCGLVHGPDVGNMLGVQLLGTVSESALCYGCSRMMCTIRKTTMPMDFDTPVHPASGKGGSTAGHSEAVALYRKVKPPYPPFRLENERLRGPSACWHLAKIPPPMLWILYHRWSG